jgi:hypothetical protein
MVAGIGEVRATAARLLFFPIAAGRLLGDPIGSGASERLGLVESCRS